MTLRPVLIEVDLISKILCDKGCVIPPLHESGHFALTGTVMRDSYSVESPFEVDERCSNVVRLPESNDRMPQINSGSQLLPKLEGGVGITSEPQPSSSREVVDLSEVLSTRDSCSEPDITSRPYGNIESVLGTAVLPVTFNGVTHLMTDRILPGLNDSLRSLSS